jgi:3' terminal RNA ribose 2'-O-methyltransferase Hen1
MLLTITVASSPKTLPDARDIGYLLYKNPATLFEKQLGFGVARVFYPEATEQSATIALLVEVDPVGLVRGRADSLFQYVSDRPYAASSFLSVAISECFSTALAGRCEKHTELLQSRHTLSATIYSVHCEAGESLIQKIFEPLGYTLSITRLPLDENFPEWGDSNLYTVVISGVQTMQNMLSHLYVLLPAIDNAKHYFVGEEEVEKLLRHGIGWLETHPEKALITKRYLRYQRALTDSALAQLVPEESEGEIASETEAESESAPKHRLNDQRIDATLSAITALTPPAASIIDLGCGEGKTLAALIKALPHAVKLAGMDVSTVALEFAAKRLNLDRPNVSERLQLFQGSLVYRDARLAGFDVGLLNEVIEHLEPDRLVALERAVFAEARPRRVILTTPNREYNSVWPSLPAGKFRHADHRFEWTRAEFAAWADRLCVAHGYTVQFFGVGEDDPEGLDRGAPTQLAIFDRTS